jgi:hypothetical protein
VLKNDSYGEEWGVWSYLEAGGFVLLIASVFIYNRVIKLWCCFSYQINDLSNTVEEKKKSYVPPLSTQNDNGGSEIGH